MPCKSQRVKLVLDESVREELMTISCSLAELKVHVDRAQMLLSYGDGETVSAIAWKLHTNRPRIERTIDKALQWGALQHLMTYRVLVGREGSPMRHGLG